MLKNRLNCIRKATEALRLLKNSRFDNRDIEK